MKPWTILLLLPLLLEGCAIGARPQAAARYDLGPAPAGRGVPALALDDVQVRAPNWLDTSAMQYRLAYAETARRRFYADSRWVAPPPSLLEQLLRERLLTAVAPAGGCRLQVDLDEFIQVFSGEAASSGRIDARAELLPPVGDVPLARHAFAAQAPAPSADARGGVAAEAAAAAELADKLSDWLSRIAGEVPAVARACAPG